MLWLSLIFSPYIQMGQDQTLNCRNNPKEKQQQIQTTHSNALHLARAMQSQQQQQPESQIKSKKSTTVRSDIDSSFPSRTSVSQKKGPTMVPQHQNLLKTAYYQFEGSEKIGSRWIERGGKSLAEIIQGRYNTNMFFPQPQVVLLIESLVYALAYLEKYGFKHHDFYPTNIFFCEGVFKITNPMVINESGYALTQQRRRFSFLSPQLIADILDDTPQAEIPSAVMFKSDIFAIGMILLEFCTLQPSADCYDEENYSLVDKKIKERLVKISKMYSSGIADCVAQMLIYSIDDRLSVSELAIGVFMNSASEKVVKEPVGQTQQAPPQSINPNIPPSPNQRQYQANPPHVQPQYMVLAGQMPPGMPQLPPGQGVPLSPNNIGLPVPNYAYSHIGPNNQGLLSPTTLQNKLRVIEKIHQQPLEEEESDGQVSSFGSNLLPTNSNEPVQKKQPQQQLQQKQQQQQQSPPQMKKVVTSPSKQVPVPQNIQPINQYQQHVNGPQNQMIFTQQMNSRQIGQNSNSQMRIVTSPPPLSQMLPPQSKPFSPPPPSQTMQYKPQSPTYQNTIVSNQSTEKQTLKMAPRYEQFNEHQNPLQSNYRHYSQSNLRNYQQTNNPQTFVSKTNGIGSMNFEKQGSYDNILTKPTFKQSNYTVPQHVYQRNSKPNQFNGQINYDGSYKGAKYTSETNYDGRTYSKKQINTSIANKYARPSDQNGETLEQRVDRILQISRNIK